MDQAKERVTPRHRRFFGALVNFESAKLSRRALARNLSMVFCRFYYFAFYVIEHYVDPGYRFSGLGSSFLDWLSKNVGGDERKPSSCTRRDHLWEYVPTRPRKFMRVTDG
jgi:hypothetical protein